MITTINEFKTNHMFDCVPPNMVTYNYELSIIFEGFQPSILKGKMLSQNQNVTEQQLLEHIKYRIDNQLKSVVSYELIKYEKINTII